jgi:hypothetical protein
MPALEVHPHDQAQNRASAFTPEPSEGAKEGASSHQGSDDLANSAELQGPGGGSSSSLHGALGMWTEGTKAISGAVGEIGDKLAPPTRHINSAEIAYAREIFGDSLDYSKIAITRDGLLSVGAPKTIGNTVHMRSKWGSEQFTKDGSGQYTLELTEAGRQLLVHEMTHVWQFQNGGLAYIPDSLVSQLRAQLGTGSRNGAYDWRSVAKAGTPWQDWNPEQQAELVEEYNKSLRHIRDATKRKHLPAKADTEMLEIGKPYIDKIQRGEGAPTLRQVWHKG